MISALAAGGESRALAMTPRHHRCPEAACVELSRSRGLHRRQRIRRARGTADERPSGHAPGSPRHRRGARHVGTRCGDTSRRSPLALSRAPPAVETRPGSPPSALALGAMSSHVADEPAANIEVRNREIVKRLLRPMCRDTPPSQRISVCLHGSRLVALHADSVLQPVADLDERISVIRTCRSLPPFECPATVAERTVRNGDVPPTRLTDPISTFSSIWRSRSRHRSSVVVSREREALPGHELHRRRQ
jgi:hypothetical protein